MALRTSHPACQHLAPVSSPTARAWPAPSTSQAHGPACSTANLTTPLSGPSPTNRVAVPGSRKQLSGFVRFVRLRVGHVFVDTRLQKDPEEPTDKPDKPDKPFPGSRKKVACHDSGQVPSSTRLAGARQGTVSFVSFVRSHVCPFWCNRSPKPRPSPRLTDLTNLTTPLSGPSPTNRVAVPGSRKQLSGLSGLSGCVLGAFLVNNLHQKDPEEPTDKTDNPFPGSREKKKLLPPFPAVLRRRRWPGIERPKLPHCQRHRPASQPRLRLRGAAGHRERVLQQSLRAIRGSHHHRVVT